MIIVLERGTTEAERSDVMRRLEELGLRGRVLDNLRKPVIHIIDGPALRAHKLLALDRIEAVLRTSGPRIRREGRGFYPYHFINWSTAALIVTGLLVLVAGFAPPGVGEAIDAHAPPEHLGAPWYLRAPFAFVHAFPQPWLGWLALVVLFAALFFLPHLDRSRGDGVRARMPVVLIGVIVAGTWIAATFVGGAL
jgi:quinol-cytochrome oxidoreductase complex cytochrome b subunit